MGERLPLIVRRHPMRPPPTRGDLERKCWRSWVGTGSASLAKRDAVPCLTTQERGGRESGQKGNPQVRPRPAPRPHVLAPAAPSVQSRKSAWLLRNLGGNWPYNGLIGNLNKQNYLFLHQIFEKCQFRRC
jgi:hypothetical protein